MSGSALVDQNTKPYKTSATSFLHKDPSKFRQYNTFTILNTLPLSLLHSMPPYNHISLGKVILSMHSMNHMKLY